MLNSPEPALLPVAMMSPSNFDGEHAHGQKQSVRVGSHDAVCESESFNQRKSQSYMRYILDAFRLSE